jgi:hypothetical protein
MLLGEYNKETHSFPNPLGFTHISYLHSDMTFPQFDWVQKLYDKFKQHPSVGIFGPRTEQCTYEDQYWTDDMIEASVAPFFITIPCLADHYKRIGGLIDPELYFQVGYCDWDMHLRNYKLGYESKVFKDVFVDHPMCGTRPELDRKDPARKKAFFYNQGYWCNKWRRHAIQDPMGCIRKGLIKKDE